MPALWDYLVVTAANDRQAAAYEAQIRQRLDRGRLSQVRSVFVAPDAGGRRIGSGGSTLQCLEEILLREGASDARALRRLRILIVHAGGDSRRLPAYSPCGKMFVPLPGDAPEALFDRLVPAFLALPCPADGAGQTVVAAGDALILFDPAEARFAPTGITALGSRCSVEEASRHGVFCAGDDGAVRLYLQKPSEPQQQEAGAIDADGLSVLDVGIMSIDASAAASLLEGFRAPAAQAAISSHGIDLYREICGALGTDATLEHYIGTARSSGSKVEDAVLAELFRALRPIQLNLQVLRECAFLHFGATNELISSGIELLTRDRGSAPPSTLLALTNEIQPGGLISGVDSWVEGCRVAAPLTLSRRSVVTGVDVIEPLALPEGACLDVSLGADRQWFIRYYGVDDTFKQSASRGATFCGQPLTEWLRKEGLSPTDVWDASLPESERTLWNARIFPAEKDPAGWTRWRWMADIDNATPAEKQNLARADRYSSQEIAVLVDQEEFLRRRAVINGQQR